MTVIDILSVLGLSILKVLILPGNILSVDMLDFALYNSSAEGLRNERFIELVLEQSFSN